uniref:ribonuclease H n=1 Tax=Seriola lalandi dorsalis TaxID=1841481 RepID=A0A3B4XT82_SERLL
MKNAIQVPFIKLAKTSGEPNLTIDINGKSTSFLVDTGASISTIKPTSSLNLKASRNTVRAVGVGVYLLSFSQTAHTVNLLGRDLLCKLNCTIFGTPEGIFLETNQDNTTAVLAALIDQYQPMKEEKGKVHYRIVSSVPSSVRASFSNDVGLIKTEPIQIMLKHNASLPRIPQYPPSQEKKEGIRPVIQTLLKQGIIVPCNSSCNTPILPVKKSQILPMPANSTHYTVLDLCSAFFSVPLHTDSQFLFAFTYDGQQYTFTRLPQGYTESLTIFSRTLHNDLKDVSLPGGSTLIQYVDDLVLASPSSTACETDNCPSQSFGRERSQDFTEEIYPENQTSQTVC